MDRSQAIRYRLMKRKYEENREALEEHKDRGPVFAAAVERLEQLMSRGDCARTGRV